MDTPVVDAPDGRPQWPACVLAKAANIRLIALDVDGIMSDGKVYFSASGDELKAFNILDGLGLKQLMAAGITVAVITGRRSPLTEKRMTDLGIPHLLQGREDKRTALLEIVDLILASQGKLDTALAPYLEPYLKPARGAESAP